MLAGPDSRKFFLQVVGIVSRAKVDLRLGGEFLQKQAQPGELIRVMLILSSDPELIGRHVRTGEIERTGTLRTPGNVLLILIGVHNDAQPQLAQVLEWQTNIVLHLPEDPNTPLKVYIFLFLSLLHPLL